MKTREALWEFLVEKMIRARGETFDDYFSERWVRATIGGRSVPVLPIWGYRKALLIHDTHHLLTGYGTHFAGELELAGWELGSGGCRWNVIFWVDRIVGVLIGLVFMPRAIWRAFRTGLRGHNLYGWKPDELLEGDVEEMRKYVGAV